MTPIRYQLKSVTARITDQDNATVLVHIPSERPDLAGLPYLKAMPTFPARINGGYGECVLDVGGYAFDAFSEGVNIDFMNLVDLYANVVDTETMAQASTRIYRGFVSAYEPYLEPSGEGVRVTCLGLASLTTASKYGTSPAYSVTHTSQDPEAIGRAVVDDFNAAFGGSLLSYSNDTTDAVGASVTKTFAERTWFEALDDVKDIAGSGWWWLIDRDGAYHLRAKPVTATHVLTINRDVERITAPKSIEKVRNEVIVARSGGTRTTYTDATSQTAFGTGSPPTGRWTEIVNDSSIGDATTANQRGNKELADRKDEKVRATVVVNRAYDIDSIKPGDTVAIRNFSGSSTFFGLSPLQIAGLTWAGDTITLELDEQGASLARELAEYVNP